MSDNLYILRIKLAWARGVWREIAIPGDHTLYDLHRAILDAFEWQDDDEHSFWMSGDIADIASLYDSNNSDAERLTRAVSLDAFGLAEGQTFLYVYGITERNRFSVRVVMVDDPDPTETYPDVVDENGESPDQSLAYYDD